jgi:AraC-like DNA-binding protein
MIKTVFRSDHLPVAERLARFDEFQLNSEHPMRVRSDAREDFCATAQALDLSAVNVVKLTCSPSEVRRTPKLIRVRDPELYSVVFALRGTVGVSQADREVVLNARDFALYDSSRPFHLRVGTGPEPATLIRAHIPRALLPLPAAGMERLFAAGIPGRSGVGALFTQFLTGLTTDEVAYRPTDIPRLSRVAVDLLTTALAHHADGEARVPDDSPQRTLLLRIEAFAQQHLHEPQLSPSTVAAAHSISVSYLHRLFRERDMTFSAWIRRQRLERARHDLADSALRAVPVHRIAARWGFNDHATFTRAFRAAFDVPPREYRDQALGSSAWVVNGRV